jgi:hypothetical protein
MAVANMVAGVNKDYNGRTENVNGYDFNSS